MGVRYRSSSKNSQSYQCSSNRVAALSAEYKFLKSTDLKPPNDLFNQYKPWSCFNRTVLAENSGQDASKMEVCIDVNTLPLKSSTTSVVSEDKLSCFELCREVNTRPLAPSGNFVADENKHLECLEQEGTDLRPSIQVFNQYEPPQASTRSHVMQDIRCENIKLPNCLHLEQQHEGQELLVTSIRQVVYRGSNRYVLGFDELSSLYLSNYWLEKELNDPYVHLKFKLKIKLGTMKTTPSKHKERSILCVHLK